MQSLAFSWNLTGGLAVIAGRTNIRLLHRKSHGRWQHFQNDILVKLNPWSGGAFGSAHMSWVSSDRCSTHKPSANGKMSFMCCQSLLIPGFHIICPKTHINSTFLLLNGCFLSIRLRCHVAKLFFYAICKETLIKHSFNIRVPWVEKSALHSSDSRL